MTIELSTQRPQKPSSRPLQRERHQMPVRSVLQAWTALPASMKWELRKTLPKPLLDALLRLVDPLGLHGHSDAMALAEEFRRLGEDEVEQLSGYLPFPLFWAVARLSQNLR